MTNLLKVDIKSNPTVTGELNPLQFILRSATAMFLEYNDQLDGAIYLINQKQWKSIVAEFDTYDIDFVVLSKHRIGA